MTATGENQSVTGASNVGGLIGYNTGTLKDAYNTTHVDGTSNIGGLIGKNAGTLSTAYNTGSAANGIVGTGDIGTNVYDVTNDTDKNNKDTYQGFDFTGTETDDYVWKIYEGQSSPWLKVFLTDAAYNGGNEFTYNGTAQGGADGTISAADGLNAYKNANSLLNNHLNTNVGKYTAWSQQIAQGSQDGSFNPNNLGYDIDMTYEINPAKLTVSDIIASITYGGDKYDVDGGKLNGEIYSQGGVKDDVHLSVNFGEKDKAYFDENTTGDYAESKGKRDTADVLRNEKGEIIAYDNALLFSDITLEGEDAKNYTLVDDTVTGDITVNPVGLDITLNDVERDYGNIGLNEGYFYGIKNSVGLTNGDTLLIFNTGYDALGGDGALYKHNNGDYRTHDANGNYSWTISAENYAQAFSGLNLGNYDINLTGGKSTVKQRELSISDIMASIVYGNQNGNGHTVSGGKLSGFVYGDEEYVKLNTDVSQISDDNLTQDYLQHKGNRVTADVGTYENGLVFSELSLVGDKSGNYRIADSVHGDITVTKAKLTMTANRAETTYGTDFDESKYGYTLSGMANEDSQESLSALIGDVQYENSAAFDDPNGRRTADAGRHKDAISITSGVNLKNYSVAFENGDAVIDKASLTVNANDASAVYGSASWNYGYKLDGLANGDTAEGLSEELSGIKYDNTAAFDGTNGRYTADAGIHEDAISVNLTGVDLKNYEVVAGNKGTAAVTPAKLTITADDQSVLLGTRPEYTGTAPADLGNQLVNGDSLDGFSYIFGVADTGLETEIGRHEGVIGLFTGGHFYGGGTHDLSTLSSVFHNYDVTVDAGTLTVSAGDNFGHLHWLHRGGERVRNFRERKAEIYFHEGGMVHEEAL